MTTQHRVHWIEALCLSTSSPAKAESWLDERYDFTARLARELVSPLVGVANSAVVYAVWLTGDHEGPVYIGQSTNPTRRLWDLPIGESHHLANSFPPEVWRSVVVIDWSFILQTDSDLNSRISTDLSTLNLNADHANKAIGLGVEHRLQLAFKPPFNMRKKQRDGSWDTVDLERSSSTGARVGKSLNIQELARRIQALMLQNAVEINQPDSLQKGEPSRQFAWAIHPYLMVNPPQAGEPSPVNSLCHPIHRKDLP